MISSSGVLDPDEQKVSGAGTGTSLLRVPSGVSRVSRVTSAVSSLRTSTHKHSATPQATLLSLPDHSRSKVNFQG